MSTMKLWYGAGAYVIVGLGVVAFGSEGRKIWKEFKDYRNGSPPMYRDLGLSTRDPQPLWRCALNLVFGVAIASLFWPLFVGELLKPKLVSPKFLSDIPIAWLKERTSIDEQEARNLVTDPRLGSEPVPFGFQHELWHELVAQMRQGDELWTYSSPPDSWEHLAGRAGVALVRNGEVIADVLTAMN